MEETLQIINQMQKEGVFTKYAIGGGIGALFYIEPIATFDLDIFIIFDDKNTFTILTPVYDWLNQEGYKPKKEHVVIEGIPVQFIPVYNDLIEEAVLNATRKKYLSTNTYVLRQEYLISIMLQTNRSKDRDRIIMLLNEAKISNELLEKILLKHKLIKSWNTFRKKFNVK